MEGWGIGVITYLACCLGGFGVAGPEDCSSLEYFEADSTGACGDGACVLEFDGKEAPALVIVKCEVCWVAVCGVCSGGGCKSAVFVGYGG